MSGEVNLTQLLQRMTPKLNSGDYVFVTIKDASILDSIETLGVFKEEEGTTLILERSKADALKFEYEFVASWITLQVHSSLEAVGLTALFSNELAKHGMACNVIAGYYHDHIFVNKKESERAIKVLTDLSKSYK